MKPKKKPAVVRMLVVVPRLPDLTMAEQRRSVRDTLRQTGDYYGLPVRVRGLAAGVTVPPGGRGPECALVCQEPRDNKGCDLGYCKRTVGVRVPHTDQGEKR